MALVQSTRRFLAIGIVMAAVVFGGAASGLLGLCGPFTDAAADAFCPFVLEVFYLGITTGTTPTTYDPTADVTRLQMAAFLSRSVDGVIRRVSGRAAADKFWVPQNENMLGLTTVGTFPKGMRFDGADIWVANGSGDTVSRVRASDGMPLQTWTGADQAWAVAVARGSILVAGASNPGKLFTIDPKLPPGGVT